MNQGGTYADIEDIGICNVNYNGNNVGFTQGNVTVEYAVSS
ncbi:unnamed protein product, partial [marine sediment metagenome]